MARRKQLSTLTYAIRPRVVTFYLGRLGFVLAILMLPPLGASLLFGESDLTLAYAATSSLVAAVAWLATRQPAPESIQINEALAISALAFIGAALANAPAFWVAGLQPIDALFEAVSGVTTTGLSTAGSVADRPRTYLVARAWSQWYGGLGIVVLSAAVMAGHGPAFRRLVAPDGASDEITAASRIYARRVFVFYLTATLLGITGLVLLSVPALHAVTHALAGISTGGFSSFDTSIAPLSGPAAYLLMALGVAGGISLPLYFRTSQQGWRQLFRDPEPLAFAAILLLLALGVAILFLEQSGLPIEDALYHGGILALSAQTTTGFSSLDLGQQPGAVLVLLVVSMAVGGSVGSTAGGLKLMRVLMLLKLFRSLVTRASLASHAVVSHWWGERKLEGSTVERLLLYMLLFIFLVFLSWLAFIFYGYDPVEALFEVVSATATAGLSTGITGPELPVPLKLLLCFDMLAGRVEIVAVLVVLYPGSWLGRRST